MCYLLITNNYMLDFIEMFAINCGPLNIAAKSGLTAFYLNLNFIGPKFLSIYAGWPGGIKISQAGTNQAALNWRLKRIRWLPVLCLRGELQTQRKNRQVNKGDANVNSIFTIGLLTIGSITILSMINILIYQHKLWEHIRKNHAERWKDLTFIGKWGLGLANGQKALTFLFSREYLNDNEVLRLKVITRNSVLYLFAGFLSLFAWASIMMSILSRY